MVLVMGTRPLNIVLSGAAHAKENKMSNETAPLAAFQVEPVVSRRTAMTEAVKILQEYWNTYDKQSGYQNYHLETFIDDAIYGLGIAIDKSQFEFADGYEKFKSMLREHLAANAVLSGAKGVEMSNDVKASPVQGIVGFSWSKVPPRTPGWYWYRYGSFLAICKVYEVDIERWNQTPHKARAEWAGPIPEPNAVLSGWPGKDKTEVKK